MTVEVGLIGRLTQIAAVITALHDKLHLSVAIDIGHRTVVQRVARSHIDTITVEHFGNGNLPILVVPWCAGGCLVVTFRTLDDGHNLVGGGFRTVIVLIVGHRQVLGHLRTVAINIVLCVVVFSRQNTPTDKDA